MLTYKRVDITEDMDYSDLYNFCIIHHTYIASIWRHQRPPERHLQTELCKQPREIKVILASSKGTLTRHLS